jgi:hypothetical protein
MDPCFKSKVLKEISEIRAMLSALRVSDAAATAAGGMALGPTGIRTVYLF